MEHHTVLVTGGTGFVGRCILKELKTNGYNIRCLVRQDSPRLDISKETGSDIVLGNIWQKDTLKAAFDGVDYVIHLVGIIKPYKDNSFERVHIEGTRNLIEEATRHGIGKFVQMSALGARKDAKSQYHKTKWIAEEIVKTSGLRYTIFRPSIIFGEDCEFLEILKQLISKPLITPIVGLGRNKLQPIYVGDVAQVFAKALSNEQSDGKTINLGGMRSMPLDEIIDIITTTMDKWKLKIHIPIYMMKPFAFLMELILSNPPITRDQLTMLKEDNICGLDEVMRLFKIDPVDFEKWAKEYFKQEKD